MNKITNIILLSTILINTMLGSSVNTFKSNSSERTINLKIEGLKIEGLEGLVERIEDLKDINPRLKVLEEIIRDMGLLQIQSEKQLKVMKKTKHLKELLINTTQNLITSIIINGFFYFILKNVLPQLNKTNSIPEELQSKETSPLSLNTIRSFLMTKSKTIFMPNTYIKPQSNPTGVT